MKLIETVFTEKNEQIILAIITVLIFGITLNYTIIFGGYDYIQSYGLGFMCAILMRVIVKDIYDWYLGK